MLTITRDHYDLLLSTDPCSIFDYYNVEQMHGLNKKDCRLHLNNNEQSYICGWANHIPHEGDYHVSDSSHLDLICNLYHELMHWAVNHYDEDLSFEEEMITIAEEETREVYELIKYLI